PHPRVRPTVDVPQVPLGQLEPPLQLQVVHRQARRTAREQAPLPVPHHPPRVRRELPSLLAQPLPQLPEPHLPGTLLLPRTLRLSGGLHLLGGGLRLLGRFRLSRLLGGLRLLG